MSKCLSASEKGRPWVGALAGVSVAIKVSLLGEMDIESLPARSRIYSRGACVAERSC